MSKLQQLKKELSSLIEYSYAGGFNAATEESIQFLLKEIEKEIEKEKKK
tara:strand:- start:2 stop:148 length:147 start_codon:yes stop_codon:yes gene_type:complete